MNNVSIPLLLVLALHGQPDGWHVDSPGGLQREHPATVRVHCVEARTASVFAGACHYGSEATTAGREALVAWHFESAVHAGVDLAGVDVVAAIAGAANLAEPANARRSILYVCDRATREQRRSAEDFVRTRFGQALGTIVETRDVPLGIDLDGDRYLVDGGDLFRVEGALIPDRACCKMPSQVWYRPLVPLSDAIVGCNAVFRYADRRLGPVWERHDENTGFAGRLSTGAGGRER